MKGKPTYSWRRRPVCAPLRTCAIAAVISVCAAQAWAGLDADRPSSASAPSDPESTNAVAHRSVVTLHAPPKSLASDAITSDWPRWLGPKHDGKSPETKLLKEFPKGGPKLVWEMQTGSGYAPPSVSGDRLMFFHRVGEVEVVECRNAGTGESLWSFQYGSTYNDRYGFSDGPKASPVIDGDHVYTYGAAGRLHCINLQTGKVVWDRDVLSDYGATAGFFGVASTPLIEGQRLIVNVGGKDATCVVAFDKKTGKEAWRAGDQWGASYASPVPGVVNGQRRVFVLAGGEKHPPVGGLLSIDPDNGHIDFRFPLRGRRYESANAASPVVVGNHVFVTTSYRTGGALLRILEGGKHELVWKNNNLKCHFATPIAVNGHLYGFDGSGKGDTALVCVELLSGKLLWRHMPEWVETLVVGGKPQAVTMGTMRGGMIYADGHFLCLGEMGDLLWLDLSPKGYKELSRSQLFYANETWTPLVMSRGLLYVTQNEKDTITGTAPRLLCYDLRAK